MTDKLAINKNETTLTKPISSPVSSGVMAGKMLALAAKMTGYKDLDQTEIDLWLEILEPYPADQIEKAFKKYLTMGRFFPKPADILASMNAPAEEVHAQREADRTAARIDEDRKTREALKEAGLPYGIDQYHSIIKQALEMVRRIPAPEPSRRERMQARLNEARKAKSNQEQASQGVADPKAPSHAR